MVSVGIVLALYICWKKDVHVPYSTAGSFLWHKYSSFLVIGILVIITYLFKRLLSDFTLSKYTLIIFYLLIILLGGYLNHYLEYLSQDYWHGSAVFNSVYNVLYGAPYDKISNCIYGNYAIVLAIPMKILGGGEYFDFSRIMCGLKISKVNSTVRLCGGINSRISRVYYFTH